MRPLRRSEKTHGYDRRANFALGLWAGGGTVLLLDTKGCQEVFEGVLPAGDTVVSGLQVAACPVDNYFFQLTNCE